MSEQPPETGRLSRVALFILRNTAVPLFLLIVAGGGLMAFGAMRSDRKAHTEGFAIVGADSGNPTVERLELPVGWTADYQSAKRGFNLGIFAPDGGFAFRVSLVAPVGHLPGGGQSLNDTSTEFARAWTAKGAKVTPRVIDGLEVSVAREDTEARFPDAWERPTYDRVTRLTYFAVGRTWCLQFEIPTGVAERFESVAGRLFRTSESLSRGDPRAEHTIEDVAAVRRNQMLRTAGGWLLGVCLPMLVILPWISLAFQVRLAADRALRVQAVEQPESPVKSKDGRDELAEAIAAFVALGFHCDGWYSLGDFEGTVLGTWQHPEHRSRGFILYYPAGGMVRLRFARRFNSGAMLVSSTRLVDHAYELPPGVFLQRMRGCVAELWEWHRTAEAMFPTRPGEPVLPPLSPLDLHLAFRRRIAKFHRTYTLWCLRYELLCELTRSSRLSGVSLYQQLERGWIPDPALYQGDGDEDA